MRTGHNDLSSTSTMKLSNRLKTSLMRTGHNDLSLTLTDFIQLSNETAWFVLSYFTHVSNSDKIDGSKTPSVKRVTVTSQ